MDYCPGCAIRVAPSEQVSAVIPYSQSQERLLEVTGQAF